MTWLEQVQARPLPFAVLMGVTFTDAQPERVTATMLVRDDLCTLGKAIHGGALMAFADTVGAAATLINLPEGAQSTTTIESKTNFIAAAKAGSTVRAVATPIHRGRRTQVWQTRVETAEGKLVAMVTQTQMVL
jgi:1,4-dihydroxy-2-naphthoyl-CoA hydrolase